MLATLMFIALAQRPAGAAGKEKAEPPSPSAAVIAGMRFRSIGPAITSGRISGIAVHPQLRSTWYVAAASGGVWKTTNAGSTWTPIFDDQGSYSIGCVELDPKNPNVVWVGSGENNSQRSVGYGDGVYRSDDAGRSWKKVGLEKSEHIGRIQIDPRDSNVVYVAAQGPLWGPGGDRGLYKTTDGGKTWNKVLAISENTGVTDVILDPRNPDVILAASYQRRRHVWTLINGGPESALHRSTDGGKTWAKIGAGLPGDELGRIGLAVAPSQPNVAYAIVESTERKGGIFRSADFGVTWEKRNDFDQQAQYYAHLRVDPENADRVYVMNVMLQVSDDGCRTLRPLGERAKHVDNHCIWVDPSDNSHYLVGCDGGLYETFDKGSTWKHHPNLPLTQFYDVTCDQTGPYYHVYGGTQDNYTLGGPNKTKSSHGITNGDWYVTQGGDGFHCKVDPKDPDTVYCESQYGGLVRFDRRTGNSVGIQPQAAPGEPPLRWNWDSPLAISPHSHTRLYYCAQRVFRSDDRGDTWTAISPDLTRQIDRNLLPVMGKVWGPDAVSKSVSTSLYGNIVALAESPAREGVVFVGTDDGLVQITEDGGKTWRKIETFAGVPERTYVSRIVASRHDANTLYVGFDAHKNSDFKPYLLKSADLGKTWTSIAGDLPANGSVLAIAEDPVDAKLLFVGTEFGLFVTNQGGTKWRRMKGGLPTIPVRDLAIQETECDLVVGTFGRGIYILDDYSPLRNLADDKLKADVAFPSRAGSIFVRSSRFGGGDKAFLGETFFTAPNPAFGASITYHLKNDEPKSRKAKRRDAEREAAKKKAPPAYPTPAELRAEAEEESSALLLAIHDAEGKLIRTIAGSGGKGFHRVVWDLRENGASLGSAGGGGGGRGGRGRRGGGEEEPDSDAFVDLPGGPFASPGTYTVKFIRRADGKFTELPLAASVVVAADASAKPEELKALLAFQRECRALQRAMDQAMEFSGAFAPRLVAVKRAVDAAPGLEPAHKATVREIEAGHRAFLVAMRGDAVMRARNENSPMSVLERLGEARGAGGGALQKPTRTAIDNRKWASEEFARQLAALKGLDGKLKTIEAALDKAGAPSTPGRLPDWKGE